MSQPQLPGFGTPGYSDYTPPTSYNRASIPAACRAAAQERSHKNSGLIALVAKYYKGLAKGTTADALADTLEASGRRVVLNTVRRCVFDLDKEGTLLPIGYGVSRYGNPQTLYVHRDYKQAHSQAIEEYLKKEEEARAEAERKRQEDTCKGN